jgi:hypothetical protein
MTKNYSNFFINLQLSSRTKSQFKREFHFVKESGVLPCFLFLILTSFASGLFINDLYDAKPTSSIKVFERNTINERYAKGALIKSKNDKNEFLIDGQKALVSVK